MLYLLDDTAPTTHFPDVENAEREPDGLLAVGGDLSLERLINAYGQGIFPWYSPGQPILWWSPNPRLVLYPEHIHVSRSLNKILRKGLFSTSMDQAFGQVMRACAAPRTDDSGTWLAEDMIEAYQRLHHHHLAHSVEVWSDGELVGGLYGVAIGRVFFGESMFSRCANASKVALVHLARTLDEWGYRLIDCQVRTEHLVSLGAQEITRREFTHLLETWRGIPGREGSWR
ncbi:MAG: leucyl/phenylalanyl-tRNA--protein transferase [Gammaproteobacteria bacterium]|nr:leucyl/phenylalanyl-tRNA--protein transferase [Gammaproteobacteria bacterium]